MPPSSGRTARIRIAALGGLRIEYNGEVVPDLPAQPVRCGLLLYLALERGATRDELAALFWPERSPGRARRSLSQMLYELRRQLGEGWLETRGDRAEVTSGVTVDALEFMAAAEAGRDDAALLAYRGPFLHGCHLGTTPAFEQWVDRRRSQLGRMHRDLCRRLTAARVGRGDAEGALAVARRWAEMDPLDDEAHHHIIERLAQAGRRSEALRHYEEYRELIARELEVEPLEETQALVARIRESAAPATGARDAAKPHRQERGAESPPLVTPPAGSAGETQRPEAARSGETPSGRPAARAAVAPEDARSAPHPERGPAASGRTEEPAPRRRLLALGGRPWRLGSLAAAILAAGMILFWGGVRAVPSADPADHGTALDPHGIAVLPFVNMSPDPEQEYFSDGITEDLLTSLSGIADLMVISRTSVMRYKGTTRTAREIGEELGVAHILEGSVRRVGDRVRIVAQLIDARTDQHLWAATYDRDVTDIFAIQSEIAQRIAAALRAQLTPGERERLAAWPTENLTAYDFYLQGRAYVSRARREDHHRGMDLYRRAIAMDSTFALAWAALGEAFAIGLSYDGVPRAWRDSAMVAARRGLALDPGLAEGYAALGVAYLARHWYTRAEDALDRALALNPNLAIAVARSGSLKFNSGQYDEAVRLYRRSIALDPAGRIRTLASLALTYAALGMIPEAYEINDLLLALEPDSREAQRHRVLFAIFAEDDLATAVELAEDYVARNPDHPRAWLSAATAWLFSREYAKAAEYLERAYASGRIGPYLGRSIAVQLGFTLLHAGERERALRLFTEFERYALREIAEGNEDPEFRYSLAALHAIQGNRSEAYRWLDEMVAAGWHHGLILARDPLLEDLHGDERFQRLLARSDAEIERQRARVLREGW